MKRLRDSNYVIWIAFALELVAAQVASDDEPKVPSFCDENDVSLIVSKLNALNEKVDMIDHKTEVKFEILTQAINDMRRSQLEQSIHFEKQLAEVSAALEKHFSNMNQIVSINLNDLAAKQRQQLEVLTAKVEFLNQNSMQTKDVIANFKNHDNENETITREFNGNQDHLKKIVTEIEDELKQQDQDNKDSTLGIEAADNTATENMATNDDQTRSTIEHSLADRMWTKWRNLTDALQTKENEILLLKQQHAEIINQTLSKHEADNQQIILLLNETNQALNLLQLQIEQGLKDNEARLNSLQSSIQTIIPKAEHMESSMPNIERNPQTSQCDLNAEFQNVQNTIDQVNQTLASVAEYLDPTLTSCTQALEKTATSGVYRLHMPHTNLPPFDAYCLEDPDGGAGWTIVQRRQDGSVSFHRNWHDYKHGFGDPSGEYWLGLEKIHAMTSKENYELWFELGDHEGETRYAKYESFEIGNDAQSYYIKSIGAYTGDAGDNLKYSETAKFTTFDNDHEYYANEDCEAYFRSAWWYTECALGGINGQYTNNDTGLGVNWPRWHGWEYSLKYVHMAIRPAKTG